MIRYQLPRIGGALLLCLLVFGFSNHHGSADGDSNHQKLEAFVTAAAAVDGVTAAWQPRITQAEEGEAEVLRKLANAEIRESIEKVDGITYVEYREIRKAIAADPEMLAEVQEIMRQQR